MFNIKLICANNYQRIDKEIASAPKQMSNKKLKYKKGELLMIDVRKMGASAPPNRLIKATIRASYIFDKI